MLKSFTIIQRFITFVEVIKLISKILVVSIAAIYISMSVGIGVENHSCVSCTDGDVCEISHNESHEHHPHDCSHHAEESTKHVCDVRSYEHQEENDDCGCSFEFYQITDNYTPDFFEYSEPIFSVLYVLFSNNDYSIINNNNQLLNFAVPLRNYKTPQIIHHCTLQV